METVTVIGAAGAIGSSILGELHRQRLFKTFNLFDPRSNVLEALRIDLTEAAITSGDDPPRINIFDSEAGATNEISSDLVICAATLGEKPGLSRSSFAAMNWELLKSLVPLIEGAAGARGSVLLVTNPIDVMAARLAQETKMLDEDRIMGYSLNDSTRLRAAIAAELVVKVQRVSAQALGMHGEALVPMFSDVRVDGERVEISPARRERIMKWMDGWFDRWQSLGTGRSSTWSTGAGVAMTVQAMREERTMPVSIATTGVDFLPEGSFIALPGILQDGGVHVDGGFTAAFAEQERLVAAAERVRRMSADLL